MADGRLPPDGIPKFTKYDAWCPRCKKRLPHDKFRKSPGRENGIDNYCGDCREKVNKEYHKKKKELKNYTGDCHHTGCETRLSMYNKGRYCSVHERHHIRG